MQTHICSIIFVFLRHLFFMHVKEDLHNGHLRMCSEQAEELSALLAQAEFGDYNQNTAQYWYSELCGEEPDAATMNRYDTLTVIQLGFQENLLKS